MNLTLLGEKLPHSLSPKIHQIVFEKTGMPGTYGLSEISREGLDAFMHVFKAGAFDGMNVTIPYKTDVIPYMDALSPQAEKIGAVNTIKREGTLLYGYNTDYDGFGALLDAHFIDVKGGRFTVLGAGGAARSVLAYLDDHGAEAIVLVSRNKARAAEKIDVSQYTCPVEMIGYENIDIADTVVINTTPVGMYPHIDASPLTPMALNGCLAVVDLIYNPETTKLMQDAKDAGIQAVNGLLMLTAQAVKAQSIWQGKEIDGGLTRYIKNQLSTKQGNLVLIGMPGCGKTTIGRALSKQLNMALVDTDEAITERYGDIPSLFKKGEPDFREKESLVAEETAMMENTVICTGGGIIKNKRNMTKLAENGTIVFIDRPVDAILSDIDHDSRPLLNGKAESLTKLYDERIALYQRYAYLVIEGMGSIEQVTKKIANAWEGRTI